MIQEESNNTVPSFAYFSDKDSRFPDEKVSGYIVGYDLRNPMNHGALIRLGDNVGAKKVFFTSDPQRFSLTKIKKTAGSSHTHMAFEFTEWNQIKKEVPDDYTWLAIETSAKAEQLYQAKLPGKCVFVVGNETHGLPTEILEQCEQHVYIPMPGHTKSMNVSHAAAVVLFEWVRRVMET